MYESKLKYFVTATERTEHNINERLHTIVSRVLSLNARDKILYLLKFTAM